MFDRTALLCNRGVDLRTATSDSIVDREWDDFIGAMLFLEKSGTLDSVVCLWILPNALQVL